MSQSSIYLDINNNKSVITALKAGEEKVFDVVYRHYFRRLCAFCSQYVGEQEEIEEIVQETMMWLWENRCTLMEELTLKIEDVETLLDDVSDVAYDKAVEVVTDTVRQETHKEDIRLVEETKKWVLSPERKAPKKEREYAAERLDGVITKIKNAMQHALAKIQRTLMQPEVKQAGKEQVKKKAKESIMDKLAKAKINADRDNRERWEREGRIAPTKKNDIEL